MTVSIFWLPPLLGPQQAEAVRGVGYALYASFQREKAMEAFRKSLDIARDLGDELARHCFIFLRP